MNRNSRKGKPIIRELIIGFGFFNGFWFAVGTSPQDEILKLLGTYSTIFPESIQKLLVILPIILTILTFITIIGIYRRGGIMGGLAVLVAFASGALILTKWKVALIMLGIAILMGLIVFREKKR